mmetsp:Transcript_32278/g.61780  ORF Transcript_32278/g.61780 Transcript_32278/m.61780 type:complete len:104 (+) Transcript_32278:164-475(+)
MLVDGNGLVALLGTYEVDVGVDPPGGDDEFLSGDDVGGRSHDHLPPRIERHAVHEVGIARLAAVVDAISLDPGVGLDDPQHCIKDDGVGDDAIEGEGGGDGGH